ncbi:hypothetical protein Q8A73_019509 [Channa argus]|nr:hypothetical protein Q8A73_019509 [Channa argus]
MNENSQEKEVLKQIEREVRMQEGASKLLAACSQREQALEASKSLLTCNARILALLSQLQRMRKAQILQREGFRPANSTHVERLRVLQKQRSSDVGPGFQLRVELYSSCVIDEFTLGTIGPRKIGRLGGSLGCSSGKKIRAAFESAGICGSTSSGGPGSLSPPLCRELSTLGPKYNLLAHTTLRIEHIQDGFKTHDLSIDTSEDSPFWLPLYGSMCCRLVAQPLCMIQPGISGQFSVKLGEELNCWENVYGVLKGQRLFCYQCQEDPESEEKPLLVIPVKKDTLLCGAYERNSQSLHISTPCEGKDVKYTLIMHTSIDAQRWTEALRQHIYNISQWKQCCHQLMKIEMPSSKKSITVKQGSLYHEIVTPPPPRDGYVCPDLSAQISTLLSSYNEERDTHNHLIVVTLQQDLYCNWKQRDTQ